jgi:hypothetical protein
MDKTTKDLLGLNFDSASRDKIEFWKEAKGDPMSEASNPFVSEHVGYDASHHIRRQTTNCYFDLETSNFRRDMMSWFRSFNCLRPVDIGCGSNRFKGKIPNIIGLDMFNDNADIVASIESNPFDINSIDGAIIFGSIQFLSKEYTLANFDISMSWIQPNSPILFKCRSKCNLEFERNIKNDKSINRTKIVRDRNIEWTDEMLEHVIEKHNLEVVKKFENQRHRHFLFIKR